MLAHAAQLATCASYLHEPGAFDWSVGFFSPCIDWQVDEGQPRAPPPMDPPPTRSPSRSPRMGRSVKARSLVIGNKINFHPFVPTIPSQIPKSQTLPANMSTPVITVRCHGNHRLLLSSTVIYNFVSVPWLFSYIYADKQRRNHYSTNIFMYEYVLHDLKKSF